jgi:HD-GYP domain-containing protein (c-di-GMP phosphodiesterase class II)
MGWYWLKEEEIPLLARIITVVDAYDVMTTKLVYKEAISKKEALKEIAENAGTQFDPKLAQIFVDLMTD